MRGNVHMKTTTNVISVALAGFAFACFALSPSTQAVVPSPDGGYPGGNTAEGQNALFSLTTGGYNTALGYFSLKSNTAASFNTAVGAGALLLNNAAENTAMGAVALLSNTTGNFNTAVGASALVKNANGGANTALGSSALAANINGNGNVAVGVSALATNEASDNTAVGNQALRDNTVGQDNAAVGLFALATNHFGNGNTAIGQGAGQNITGNSNICIGQGVFGVAGENNTIRVGDNLPATQGQSACYIGGIYTQAAVGGGIVSVNPDGKLGTTVSSRRFKQDIKPMDKASEVLLALTPVTFRYKKELDPMGMPQFGLVAEDVEKVSPNLVVHDKDGKPHSVRYDQVNAMLLNEFLKEHKKVEEQEKTIVELKSGMITLAATVKEQAVQIQKVRAQLELSKAAPQTAENTQ
jgi:Chaperone of endosialidase